MAQYLSSTLLSCSIQMYRPGNLSQRNRKYTYLIQLLILNFRHTPIHREFVHWAVVNIPGADGKSEVGAGETVLPYLGIGPFYNSGIHRFVKTFRPRRVGKPINSLIFSSFDVPGSFFCFFDKRWK